jgi:hypothetical protein
MSPDFLVAGAFIGSILTFVAIAIPRYTRHLLAAGLVIAALDYTAFALGARAGIAWLAVELAGVAIYGALALRGFRGSGWWLVAGWALHPVWDVAIHFAGPGHAFAPEWYTVSCITWDLATASISAIAILIGTHLSPPRSFRAERAARSRGIAQLSFRAERAARCRGIAQLSFRGTALRIRRWIPRLRAFGASLGMTVPSARLAPACACECPTCTATEARAA